MAPSTAMEFLQHCCNVTEIAFDTCLNVNEVQKVVEMKFLRKLEIRWIKSVPIEPIIVAFSKLEELFLKCDLSSYNILCCLDMWANSGFKLVSRGQTLYSRRAFIACSISARAKRVWNSSQQLLVQLPSLW